LIITAAPALIPTVLPTIAPTPILTSSPYQSIDPLVLLEKVDSFYNGAWVKILVVITILIPIIIVVLTFLSNRFQQLTLTQKGEKIKKDLKDYVNGTEKDLKEYVNNIQNDIKKSIDNINSELTSINDEVRIQKLALTQEGEKIKKDLKEYVGSIEKDLKEYVNNIQDDIKKSINSINSELTNINDEVHIVRGGVYLVQANTCISDKRYYDATISSINALWEFIQSKRRNHIQGSLYNLIEICLPQLKDADILKIAKIEKGSQIKDILSFLKKVTDDRYSKEIDVIRKAFGKHLTEAASTSEKKGKS
jgi:gas vesicle protein